MNESSSTEAATGQAKAVLQRLEALAEGGIRSDADVSWFSGPNGFLRCCQIEAGGMRLPVADDVLADLLAEIDDRLTVIGGTTVSARALALRTMAAAQDPVAADAAAALLVASVVGSEPRPELVRSADLVASDALRLLSSPSELGNGELPTADARFRLSVPIVVSTHARGELVRLDLRRVQGLPGIAPDILEAPFQRFDADFLAAMVDAHSAALGSRGSWRFSVHSVRTGVPLDAVMGQSGGLGAAIGLRLHDRQGGVGGALDPRWIFTGYVSKAGMVDALLDRSGANTYRNKLQAAQGMTLLVPAADVSALEPLMSGIDCELLGVETLDDAIDLVNRHHRGSTAYQRLMDRPRPTRRSYLLVPIVLLCLLGLAAAWIYRDNAAERGRERIRRENPPLRVEPIAGSGLPAGSTILFTRTETTNAAYRACVVALVCPQPVGRQARPLDRPGNEQYPVTGITAADAEVFCHWVYGDDWGLPTLDQMRAAVAVNYRQFPFGKLADAALEEPPQGLPVGELARVDDPAVDGRELAWITGNAAEWTRTQCVEGWCQNMRSVGDARIQGLRVFGISYLDADEQTPADWLSSSYFPQDVVRADSGNDWTSFRCASEE